MRRMKCKTTGSGSMARTETAPSSGMNPSLLVLPLDDAQSVAHAPRAASGFGRRWRLRKRDRADVVRVDCAADVLEDLSLHRVVDREQDHGLLALPGPADFHPRDVDV